MREIGDIHVFEDRAFLRGVSRVSIVVLLLGCVAVAVWYALVAAVGDAVGRELSAFEIGWGTLFSRPAWWAALAIGLVLSLVVHELVHGFFFRQLAPAGARVTYGASWRHGMFYACAEGVVFTRRQYEAALIAPTIVVTCGLIVIGLGLKWPLWTIVVATLHLSGCTGDWGYLARMRRDPAITHCEDTSFGVRFLSDLPEGVDGFGPDSSYDFDGEPAWAEPVREPPEAPIEVDFGGDAPVAAGDDRRTARSGTNGGSDGDAARPRLVMLDGGASDGGGTGSQHVQGAQPGSDGDGLPAAEPMPDGPAPTSDPRSGETDGGDARS